MTYEANPGPGTPQLSGTHPPHTSDDADARYSADRTSTVIHAELARWLLTKETSNVETDSAGLCAAAERVCQQLCSRLFGLVSPFGSQAIVSRALHLRRAEFPFLEGVCAGRAPDACLDGLSKLQDIGPNDTLRALVAVLGTILDLLVEIIGEDLTFRVVRQVWLDVPVQEPSRPRRSLDQEIAR